MGLRMNIARSTWIVRNATPDPTRIPAISPQTATIPASVSTRIWSSRIRRPSARRVTSSTATLHDKPEDEDRDGRDAHQRRERGPEFDQAAHVQRRQARPVLVEGRLGRVDVDRAGSGCLRPQRRRRPGESGMTVVGGFGEEESIRRSPVAFSYRRGPRRGSHLPVPGSGRTSRPRRKLRRSPAPCPAPG